MVASIRIRWCGALLVCMLGAAWLGGPTIHADSRSLFGRTPAFADTEYSSLLLTPDNRFVVFKADLDTDGVYNLYRVPLAGGAPVQLSAPVAAGSGVWSYQLTLDGSRVVYAAYQEVDQRLELYSVPVDGGTPVKLNRALPNGGNIGNFQISANSKTVVYQADQDTNDVSELYSVPVAGGAPVKLSGPLVPGGDVSQFAITPQSTYVAYLADQEVDARDELYGVPIGGGDVQKINGALASGGEVDYFTMNPTIGVVTYVAKQGSTSTYELFSAFITGLPIAKLNGALPAGKRVTYSYFSPDGSRVLYVVGNGFFGNASGTLYSVLIGGGASIQLSPTPGADGDVSYVRVSNNSTYATFSYKASSSATTTFYSAPLATGTRNSLYSATANHTIYDLALSPDSAWMVFTDSDTAPGERENTIQAVPIGGGTAVQLSFSSEYAYKPVTSPKSDRVLFLATNNTNTCPEYNLYSVQIFGGGRRTLSGLCGTTSNVADMIWSKDGSVIVFKVQYNNEHGTTAGFELLASDGQAVQPTATPAPSAQPTAPPATPTASAAPATPTTPAQAPPNRLYVPLLQRP